MYIEPLILTFDCGTQSVRAMLFSSKGELLGKKKLVFEPYFTTQKGYAEQHPEFYYKNICNAALELKTEHIEIWKNIVGVTVTTMRDTGVYLDKDGNVIRPSILWLDNRKAENSNKMPFISKLLFKLAAMGETAKVNFKRSKSNWIWENEPETWDKTSKFMQLSGYINFKLTNNYIDSYASQVGLIPFNYRHKRWNKENNFKNCIFNIPLDKMIDLAAPAEQLGTINEKASEETGIPLGTPVYASGSDKGCETLGTGVTKPGMAGLSFGTTSTIQIATEKFVAPQRFLPPYPAVYKGQFNPEMEIFRGYWMVTWFKNELALADILESEKTNFSPEGFLDTKLSEIPVGSDGLILQPYWGAGLKTPEARGAIIGFSDVHTRAHIYKAILEGINYGLIDGMNKLQKRSHTKISLITVSGGGSQSDVVCQMTADMFGLPVKRVQTYETSGLGSSIAGFVGAKVFKDFDEAIEKMVHYESHFEPNMENHARYIEIYNHVYRKIYPKLKPIFLEMKARKI